MRERQRATELEDDTEAKFRTFSTIFCCCGLGASGRNLRQTERRREADTHAGRQADARRQAGQGRAGRHTDAQTHRHTDTQTHRHTDAQTHRHRHTDTQTHRHTDTDTEGTGYSQRLSQGDWI